MTVLRRLFRGRDLVQEVRLAVKMTLAGTLAWWAVVHFSLTSTLAVAVALGAGTVLGIALRIGPRPNVQAAVSALFMIGVAGSSQAGVDRVWETAIGAVLSVLVAALLWPPDPVRELRHRLERLRQQLAVDLAGVAAGLASGAGVSTAQLEDVRAHSRAAVRDVFELEPARRALRLSPLRRGDRLLVLDLETRINLAARLYRHARSVARDVSDLSVRSATLATATRHLADAADRSLAGGDPVRALDRADGALAEPVAGEAAFVAAQLRQLGADLRVAAAEHEPERHEDEAEAREDER